MLLMKDNKNSRLKFGNEFYAIRDIEPNRFFYHNQNGMFIISAMTQPIPIGKKYSEFSPDEKEAMKIGLARTKELQKDIRKEGLGYISTLGGYPYHNENLDEVYDANEFSMIVPRNPKLFDEEEFVELAIELCKKYDQEAILVAGISFIDNGQARYLKPGEESKYMIDPDFKFKSLHTTKEFDPEKRPYYTRLKQGGKETFTYSTDSKSIVLDEESTKNLGKYFATRAPIGWAANCAAGQNGEILLKYWK